MDIPHKDGSRLLHLACEGVCFKLHPLIYHTDHNREHTITIFYTPSNRADNIIFTFSCVSFIPLSQNDLDMVKMLVLGEIFFLVFCLCIFMFHLISLLSSFFLPGAKADIDQRDNKGYSALHVAAKFGCLEAIKVCFSFFPSLFSVDFSCVTFYFSVLSYVPNSSVALNILWLALLSCLSLFQFANIPQQLLVQELGANIESTDFLHVSFFLSLFLSSIFYPVLTLSFREADPFTLLPNMVTKMLLACFDF